MSEGEAIQFAYVASRTMADGSLRITVEIEPRDAVRAFSMFNDPGVPGAMVRLQREAAQKAGQEKPAFGNDAKVLRQSGFFRTKSVWQCIGSPDDYRRWVHTQPCIASGSGCHGDVVAAHVRRIKDGAGMGIKPDYAEVPLCDRHHRFQHQQGESAVMAPEEFDRQRIQHVEQWAWETLKAALGYNSWAEVPPPVLREWAAEHGLEGVVPNDYGRAADE